MIPTADSWAIEAAKLPLAFAQVREDSRLDMEIVRQFSSARVVMIASGGETAVCLARLRLARLLLVDINPAQLALTRCRMHLAQTTTCAESLALLGHIPMAPTARHEQWTKIFQKLNLQFDALGPISLVAKLGADHCGRYEMAFAELKRLLLPEIEEVARFLVSTDVDRASSMISPSTKLGTAMDVAFASALRLENLIALFGEAATRNPRQTFHRHFIQQLREITARIAPDQNPWIWQLLAGKFPPNYPVDWLIDHTPILANPEYRCCPMLEALKDCEPGSVDFIHLSNILDWLSIEEASETLEAAYRALTPRGVVMIRQLNSNLEIPSLFPDLRWDQQEGNRLQQMDRSFFYPNVLLASRA